MSWWGLVLNVASTKISVVSAKNEKKNKDREKIHDPSTNNDNNNDMLTFDDR